MDTDCFVDEHTNLTHSYLAEKWNFDYSDDDKDRSINLRRREVNVNANMVDKWSDRLTLSPIKENSEVRL